MPDAARSLREHLSIVLSLWFLYLPGVLGGIEWAGPKVGLTVPTLPAWAWAILFVGGFVAAQFWAFHKVRVQRDAKPLPPRQVTQNFFANHMTVVGAQPTSATTVGGPVTVTETTKRGPRKRRRRRNGGGQGQLPLG